MARGQKAVVFLPFATNRSANLGESSLILLFANRTKGRDFTLIFYFGGALVLVRIKTKLTSQTPGATFFIFQTES